MTTKIKETVLEQFVQPNQWTHLLANVSFGNKESALEDLEKRVAKITSGDDDFYETEIKARKKQVARLKAELKQAALNFKKNDKWIDEIQALSNLLTSKINDLRLLVKLQEEQMSKWEVMRKELENADV